MKIIAIALLLVTVVTANDESKEESSGDCKSWPSNLKSLQECCTVPYHLNSMIQNVCQVKCLMKSKDLQNDCNADCYVNMTGLIKDEKINKLVAKRIYENNIYNERQWIKTISDGVDKCEYEKKGTVTESLVQFYNCANDFLAENCLTFNQGFDCYETEEHFEKCKNIEPNCTVWPTNMIHPEACCKLPVLIPEKLVTKCRIQCQRKELFSKNINECSQNCTFQEAGLKADGKISFEVVKTNLIENSNKSEAWEKPISEALEVCEKTIKEIDHFKNSDTTLYQLMRCLNEQLGDKCVEFSSEPYCHKVKRFMSKCPDAKPRHPKLYYKSVHVSYNANN